jgi:histidinol-phosphate aminotransferase
VTDVEPADDLVPAPVGTRRRPQPRDGVRLMEGYHSPQVDVKVRLNTNEAPAPPPAEFAERLAAELAKVQWHRYPDRAATELRQGIAALHGVALEQVFAANGSNEVLQTVCLAYGGAGRTAAVFEPTYALHSHIARITGTEVVFGERLPDYRLDWAEVQRLMTTAAPDITFLCSPNNPTGLVEDEATVRAVLGMAPGLLVVDEAYGQFAPWSALDLVDEETPLVVTRTYSKTWSMAAARLGYLVGPRWLVAELDKVVLPYHLDTVKQIAGRLALDYRTAMDRRVAALVTERDELVTALGSLPLEVWPTGANFLLVRPKPAAGVTGRELWQALLDRSILVRDCSSWPRLAGCLRITVGTPEEDDVLLAALEEIFG